jgi:hypothetical protein
LERYNTKKLNWKEGEANLKHGKRLTRKQKILLKEYRLDPLNWLVVKDTSDFLEIVNRSSEKVRRLSKEG